MSRLASIPQKKEEEKEKKKKEKQIAYDKSAKKRAELMTKLQKEKKKQKPLTKSVLNFKKRIIKEDLDGNIKTNRKILQEVLEKKLGKDFKEKSVRTIKPTKYSTKDIKGGQVKIDTLIKMYNDIVDNRTTK